MGHPNLAEAQRSGHPPALATEQSDPDKSVAAGTIAAQQFVVRDERWQQRAVLGLNEGFSGLWLYDANGNPRAGLTVHTEGAPSFALRDREGRAVVDICVDEHGPKISLFDVNGKQEAVLTTGSAFFFANGKPRVKLGLSSESEFVISGKGEIGPKEHQNLPVLVLCDEDGRGSNFLILTPNGPRLRLQDRQGNEVRLQVEYETGIAFVGILSKDGRVRWSAA